MAALQPEVQAPDVQGFGGGDDDDLEVGAAKGRTEKAAQGAIKVTPAMVERVMAALRNMGVDVLRAPYEADAQLAYLAKRGSVSAVLTEDSDLISCRRACVPGK